MSGGSVLRAIEKHLSGDRKELQMGVPVWLLGGRLRTTTARDMEHLYRVFHSILWMTYRRNFVNIEPSLYTSDTGWGCMLRSGQMVLAQALQRHHLGRSWCAAGREMTKQHTARYLKLLRWFNDEPRQLYSIHKMVQVGSRMPSGKAPGEWYGPHACTHVIRRLVEIHQKGLRHPFTVCIAADGVLYLDDVDKLCRTGSTTATPSPGPPPPGSDAKTEAAAGKAGGSAATSSSSGASSTGEKEKEKGAWTNSLLIFAPLRLGLGELNTAYLPSLLAATELPQSVGFIGGRPCESVYFVGHQGRHFLCLDPHTTQEAVSMKKITPKKLKTFHCARPRLLPFNSIDPSLALGFYCHDEAEFLDLVRRLRQLARQPMPLLSVAEKRPEYDGGGRGSGGGSGLSCPPPSGDIPTGGAAAGSLPPPVPGSSDAGGTKAGGDDDDDDFVLL